MRWRVAETYTDTLLDAWIAYARDLEWRYSVALFARDQAEALLVPPETDDDEIPF